MQRKCSAGGVRLSRLLPKGRFFGADDIRVTSCCADSRSCRPGDLFVAHDGSLDAGHDQVQNALSRGAAAVLTERLLPASVPQCVVPDTRVAFAKLCHALAGNPSRHLYVVGITGTRGKTSTQALLAGVMKSAGYPVAVLGSSGGSDGSQSSAHDSSPARSAELARWLAESRANGCTHAVIEVTSEMLATRGLSGTQLDAAIITNLRSEHLDVHGSTLNYRKAKQRLLNHLKRTGVAVINSDDPGTQAIVNKIRHPMLTVSLKSGAEITASVIERHRSEQTFLLEAGRDAVAVRTQIIGDPHIYNCLSAAAVGLMMGLDLATIASGLESVCCVPGCLERVECGQDFGVFIDDGQTAESLAQSIRTLRTVTDGRLICVFGEGPARAASERPRRGRVVENLADLAVVTSDEPNNPQPLQAAHDLLDGFDRPAQAHLLPNRVKAICWALSQAKPNDTVLISGPRSRCLHADRHNHENNASDADVARHWLSKVGPERTCPWVPA